MEEFLTRSPAGVYWGTVLAVLSLRGLEEPSQHGTGGFIVKRPQENLVLHCPGRVDAGHHLEELLLCTLE